MASLFLNNSASPTLSTEAGVDSGQQRQVWLRRAVLLLILLVAGYLREHDRDYITAFVDEGSFIMVGKMVLANPWQVPFSTPLNYMFGWYLWPVMAGAAHQLGGLSAVRALTGILGVLVVFGVYGFARRLFNEEIGLASAGIFALLAPAVYTSRMGTYDSSALCFLIFGLWLYARAWQEEKGWIWFLSGICFLLSFLSKYFVALYFPFLVVLAFRKGRKPLWLFSTPLALYCAIFLFRYWNNMVALIHFGQGHKEVTAPDSQLWGIYVVNRMDFWVLAALSLLAWPRRNDQRKWLVALLWLGGVVMLAFQAWSRADYNTYKHINYSLLFIVPLSMAGLFRLLCKLPRKLYLPTASMLVAALAISFGFAGHSWQLEKFEFWPDVTPILNFLDGRLKPETKLLADDLIFQFYVDGSLKPGRTTYPWYLDYAGVTGAPAFSAAVRDGVFDYIILDGWASPHSREMRDAIRPALSDRYTLRLDKRIRQMTGRVEIYERTRPPRLQPILELLNIRLHPESWMLSENRDFWHYLAPPRQPNHLIDPEGFEYGDKTGIAGCAEAVRDGFFSLVVLGGGSDEKSRQLRGSIAPLLSQHYSLEWQIADLDGREQYQIYARIPAEATIPRVEIREPATGATVKTKGIETLLKGVAFGAASGWYARVEVYTNRWYPQGDKVFLNPADGSFTQPIFLGGPCLHFVRVRLFDEAGKQVTNASSYGVTRANPDGSAPSCP